jgi:NADH:ubiquinone oxidoreductase subunit E
MLVRSRNLFSERQILASILRIPWHHHCWYKGMTDPRKQRLHVKRITDLLNQAPSQSRSNGQSINILKTLLHMQTELGFVPPASLPEISLELGKTEAEVSGVLSFYPDLRTKAAGRHVVRICQGESCVANHCERLLKALEKKLGIGLGSTTVDGRFTLEKVYCMGNCAAAPTVVIDSDVHGRVLPMDVHTLLKDYR